MTGVVVTAVFVVAVAVGSLFLGGEGDAEPEQQLDVILARGSFDGMPWTYGLSEFTDGKRCAGLVMDAADGGCGAFAPPIRGVKFYTTTAGHPSGILTAEGFVSRDVASVVMLAGGREAGEARIIDLPEPVAGKSRGVIAFVEDADLGVQDWVAIALDPESRVIGRTVLR